MNSFPCYCVQCMIKHAMKDDPKDFAHYTSFKVQKSRTLKPRNDKPAIYFRPLPPRDAIIIDDIDLNEDADTFMAAKTLVAMSKNSVIIID